MRECYSRPSATFSACGLRQNKASAFFPKPQFDQINSAYFRKDGAGLVKVAGCYIWLASYLDKPPGRTEEEQDVPLSRVPSKLYYMSIFPVSLFLKISFLCYRRILTLRLWAHPRGSLPATHQAAWRIQAQIPLSAAVYMHLSSPGVPRKPTWNPR